MRAWPRERRRNPGLRANPYTELLDAIDVHGRLDGRDPVNHALYLWLHTNLPTYVLTFLGSALPTTPPVLWRGEQ
jgi:hypothetical protein